MNGIILMTRIPWPGHTKTRLMPFLTPEQCAGLHACFLKDYEACFDALGSGVGFFTAYGPEHAASEGLALLPMLGVRFPQQGEDLGQRMLHAFETVMDQGFRKAVLVGADIPHLQPEAYRKAFDALDSSDVVLGPTVDGGYCLIGMKRVHRELFSNALAWGAASVLEGTCRIAEAAGLSVTLLEPLQDIDTVEDLQGVYRSLTARRQAVECFPENTFRYMETHLDEVIEHGCTAD